MLGRLICTIRAAKLAIRIKSGADDVLSAADAGTVHGFVDALHPREYATIVEITRGWGGDEAAAFVLDYLALRIAEKANATPVAEQNYKAVCEVLDLFMRRALKKRQGMHFVAEHGAYGQLIQEHLGDAFGIEITVRRLADAFDREHARQG